MLELSVATACVDGSTPWYGMVWHGMVSVRVVLFIVLSKKPTTKPKQLQHSRTRLIRSRFELAGSNKAKAKDTPRAVMVWYGMVWYGMVVTSTVASTVVWQNSAEVCWQPERPGPCSNRDSGTTQTLQMPLSHYYV